MFPKMTCISHLGPILGSTHLQPSIACLHRNHTCNMRQTVCRGILSGNKFKEQETFRNCSKGLLNIQFDIMLKMSLNFLMDIEQTSM